MKIKPIISLMSLSLAVAGQAPAQYASSSNGVITTWNIDQASNPGGNELNNYTGSWHTGATWSLNMSNLNPSSGNESMAQNPYNYRISSDGTRVDQNAASIAPWNNVNAGFHNAWNSNVDPLASFYRSYAVGASSGADDYSVTGGVNHFISGGQTYFADTRYEFTFDQPVTEFFMYIQNLDDAWFYDFSIAPEIFTTATYTWSDVYGGDGHQKATLVYAQSSVTGAWGIKDFDGKGEGDGIGSAGLPFQAWPGNHQNEWWWNPSASGILRFYDPNGISNFGFSSGLLPSDLDGAAGEDSDGAHWMLAMRTIPEPSVALLGVIAGVFGVLRRRRA